MKKVEVTLTTARAGAAPAQRGDVITVGLSEACRMNAAGQIERPSAAVLKEFAKIDAEAETAAAKRDAETADAAEADALAKAAKDQEALAAALAKAAADQATADAALAKAATDQATADAALAKAAVDQKAADAVLSDAADAEALAADTTKG